MWWWSVFLLSLSTIKFASGQYGGEGYNSTLEDGSIYQGSRGPQGLPEGEGILTKLNGDTYK